MAEGRRNEFSLDCEQTKSSYSVHSVVPLFHPPHSLSPSPTHRTFQHRNGGVHNLSIVLLPLCHFIDVVFREQKERPNNVIGSKARILKGT